MTRLHRKWLCLTVAVAMATAAGCSSTGGKSAGKDKNAATAQWRMARASVLMTLARDQFNTGQFDQARVTIADAIRLLPDNPEVRTLSGRIAFEQGNLELAEAEFRAAQAADPNFAPADYYLGIVMQRWQRYPRALELYASASRKNPMEVAYLTAQAEMLVMLDRSPDALLLLQQALPRFENSADLRAAIGHVLLRQRRFAEAADMLRQALLLAPQDDVVRETLARAQFQAGRFDDAAETLARLLRNERYRDRADLHTLLGECHLEAGRPHDARAAFETASQLQPGNLTYILNLAKAALEVDDLRRAELAVRRALAISPSDGQANLMLGYVRLQQQRYPEALAAFRRAAQADNRDPTAVTMSGLTLERMGRKEEAMREYARALELRPNDELARQRLNQLAAAAAGD